MESLIFQTIWVPGLAGLICLILVRVKGAEGFLDWIRKLLTLVVSAYVIYLGWRLLGAEGTVANLGTVTLGSLSTRVLFRVTHLGAIMVLFTGIFALLTTIFSARYRAGAFHNNWYYCLVLWTIGAANAVFLAGDLFSLMIFWELSTVFLFGLIALGDNEKTPFAAGKTLVVLGLAETAMLFAVAYIWATQGTLVLDELSLPLSVGTNVVLYLLIIVAALAKAGVFPLHSWVPSAAEGGPTSAVAFIPASLDKLMGIYLFTMVSWNLFHLSEGLKLAMMIVGAVSLIVAVVMAMLQHDLRKLLAYHAVSQAGYMVLGIGTGTIVGILGGLFHMLNNAFYKGGLFLGAGAVEKEAGTTDLEKLGGLGRKMKGLFWPMLIFAFAISGVPPFNGFASKWMIYQGLVEAKRPILLVIAMFGSGLTLASFIKVLHSTFFGPTPPGIEEKVKGSGGFAYVFPVWVIAIVCVITGFFPSLAVKPFAESMGYINVGELGLTKVAFGSAYWQPLLMFGLMFLGFVVAWIYYAAGKALKARRDEMFIGGIKPSTLTGYHIFDYESTRVPGTGFYNTIKELPILRTILPDAEEGAFDPYRYISKLGESLFVRPLKVLHNGILSHYLTWAIIGLVCIMVILRTHLISILR
ncbi:hypothetical protein J7K99_04570 [bacterium]|nr:hypothetical protein [bacterium]